jgi:peptidoglycan-associated lipoprotein
MEINTLKLVLMGMLLSLVLAGCSTTDTDTDTDTNGGSSSATGSEQVRPDNVISQKVDRDGSLIGEDVMSGDTAVNIDSVFYFEFDKSLLKPEARAALALHAEQLNKSPRNIRLEGHADERGTREYNLALGERRANSVRDFLVLQGVDSATIEVVSYGEELPAEMVSSDAAWSMNRRVELK